MGRVTGQRSARLAEKLLQIRLALGLSQNELIRHLGLPDVIMQGSVSGYELGTREPPLPVLLKYAHAANVYVDVLIDDTLDLPGQLPAKVKHAGVRYASEKGQSRR